MKPLRRSIFLTARCNALCLLAMIALFASAVSACACGHHRTSEAAVADQDAPSCHASAHAEAAETTVEPALSDSLQEGCTCVAAIRGPAITAKSENKRLGFATADAAVGRSELDFPVAIVPDQPRAAVISPISGYSFISKRSGPSRAPPRL